MNLIVQRGPVRSRVLYDLLAAAGSALGTYVFLAISLGVWAPQLFAAPLLVVGGNWAVGIYTRARIGAGLVKAARLSVSVSASAIVLWLATRSPAAAVLWAGLVWGPLVLPRVLLNLNTRVKTNFITSAIVDNGPVLVIGGAGYIGTHVVSELLQRQRPVRVLDRLIYGRDPIRDFVGDPRFELVEGDVTDIVKLLEAMKGASAVVHLAGLVGDPACAVDEAFTRHANVISTRIAKEAALSLGVPRFVFASSCSVYGSTEREVSESDDLNPVSLYAQTKIDSERELLLCTDENFTVTVLRFATVFGHSRRARFDLVANLFTAQAFIDGKVTVTGESQWRPFVHVRDLARAIVAVLDADTGKVRGQVLNVGDQRLNMTIGQLAETVREIVSRERDVEVVCQPDVTDRRNYAVSFKKIQSLLGFHCATTIPQGVEEMLAEFKKGTYGNYHERSYSNVEMTKLALSDFRDPALTSRLYVPLAEVAALGRGVAPGGGR
jgi:nucleoside-diphosphate-sugar epimerase